MEKVKGSEQWEDIKTKAMQGIDAVEALSDDLLKAERRIQVALV